MYSGEIGSLQPRTSYAVVRMIGSREMAPHAPHDASIKTQSKQRCRRVLSGFSSEQARPIVVIVGQAIDRGRNFASCRTF